MIWIKRFVAAKASSSSYALAYIFMIPLFAFVYALMPSNFYHATAKYEKSVAGDLEAIRYGIESSLIRTMQKQYGTKLVQSNGWFLRGNKVNLDKIVLKDGVFSCNLIMTVERIKNNSPERWSGTLSTMSFNGLASPIIKDNGECDFMLKRITFSEKDFADFNPYMILAKPPEGYSGAPPEVKFLVIPVELNNQIVSYNEASDGFPSHSSGTFLRMFYFSAVTITTLGYGDILPITDFARTVVALEAISGIVIIGYYLASLSTQASKS